MIKIQFLKKAAEEELQELNALLLQLSPSKKPMTLAYLNKMLSVGASTLLVLKDGKKIVGMATLALIYIPTGPESWAEDVVVDSNYRGRGLGEKLMRALMALAKKKNASSLNLTSRPSRAAANKLYQKLGFERRETNVYRLKLAKK